MPKMLPKSSKTLGFSQYFIAFQSKHTVRPIYEIFRLDKAGQSQQGSSSTSSATSYNAWDLERLPATLCGRAARKEGGVAEERVLCESFLSNVRF